MESVPGARFEPLPESEKLKYGAIRPSLSYWQDAGRRFRKNVPAMICAAVLAVIIVAAIVIPFFWPYTYSEQDLSARNQFPSAQHIFGTDNLGRDLFIRVIYGARISLSIGIVASIINLTIGVLYGGLSGYLGGKTDNVLMRIVDLLYSVPLLLYVILLQVVLEAPIKKAFENASGVLHSIRTIGPELFMIFLVLGMVYWVGMARMVRGQVLQLKGQEFVLAARSQGAGMFRIILRHLIPNVIGQIIVMVMMSIPQAIFTEAFLSFIGLGVSAPLASWGSLASNAYQSLQSYPYLLLFPAGAICITVLSFNILGDGLRDALDPHMKK
jgi:oligopeptide transport system permease protein